MVTRRCSQRRFLMLPDGDTTNAFLYCLAYAASRSGVGILFFIACSNHWLLAHWMVTSRSDAVDGSSLMRRSNLGAVLNKV